MDNKSKLFNRVGTFVVDEISSNEQRLFVDVRGLGTVAIEVHDNGILVDIFSLHVFVDKPVASAWAQINELTENNDETSSAIL